MKKIFISFITIGGIACASFAGDAVTFSKLSAGGSGGSQNNTTTSNQQPTILYGGVTHNENKSQYEEITAENLNVKILELIMTGEVSGNVEPTTVEVPKTTDKDLGDFVPASKPGSNNGNYPGDFVPTSDVKLPGGISDKTPPLPTEVKLPGGISDKTPPLPEKTTNTAKQILEFLDQVQKNIPKQSGADNNVSGKTDSDAKQSAGTNSTPPEDNSVTTTDSDPEWVAKLGEKIAELYKQLDEIGEFVKSAGKILSKASNIANALNKIADASNKIIDSFIETCLYPQEILDAINEKIDYLSQQFRKSNGAARGEIQAQVQQLKKMREQFQKASQVAKGKFQLLKKAGGLLKKAGGVGPYIDLGLAGIDVATAKTNIAIGLLTNNLELYKEGRVADLMAGGDFIANTIDSGFWLGTAVEGGIAQVVPGGADYSDYMDAYKNHPIKKEWEKYRANTEKAFGKMAEIEFNMIQNIKNHAQNPKEVQIPHTGEIRAMPAPEMRSAKPMEIHAPENTRTVPGTGEIRKNNE